MWSGVSITECAPVLLGLRASHDLQQLLSVVVHYSPSLRRCRSAHSVIRRLATACFGGSQRMGGSPLLGGVFTCRAAVISSRLNQRASSSSVWSTFNWRTGSRSRDTSLSTTGGCTCSPCKKYLHSHLSVGRANRGVAAQHEGAVRKRPVLWGAVRETVNLQTHLLCHLPAQSLLQSLTWDHHRQTDSKHVV